MPVLSKTFTLLWLLAAALSGKYLESYAAVVEKAKAENKIGMVLMIASYCPWCERMKNETLRHPDVARELKEHFVVGIINKEEDDTYPEYLHPNFVPVVYFLNHEEHVINDSYGFKKAIYFLDDLERARYMFEPN